MKEEEREGGFLLEMKNCEGKKVKFLFFFNDNRIFDREDSRKMEERFSIFLYIYRDSNGANWHVAPFLATLFSFSALVPRISKEFEPCTYPPFIRFRKDRVPPIHPFSDG